MTDAWDGRERRKMNTEERDMLIEVKNDMKHLVAWTHEHSELDDQRHRDSLMKFDKIDKDITWSNKILYGALGIIAFITFITNFIK